jgi:adenylate cyclase class 2
MSQVQPGIENEVKLPLADAADGQRRIAALQIPVRTPRIFEENMLYDTADDTIRRSGSTLRLRKSGEHSVLTYKGPPLPGKHKTREEVETTVGRMEDLATILGHLGYRPTFQYEKYRTEYAEEGSPGLITLDETPIGTFFELEGPPEWIDWTAKRLGFQESQYIVKSYVSLYFQECNRTEMVPGHMVFPKV